MSYQRHNFVSKQKLTAQALNEIEDGIISNETAIKNLNNISSFIQNTDIDYAFDSATNANYTIIRIYKNKIDGTQQYPFVYAPNGINSGTKTTYDLSYTEGWLLAINAGVFNTSNVKPDGILIQNGEVLQGTATTTHSQCKPLTIDRNGNLGYTEYNANADTLVNNGIVSAVTGFIPIIVNYEKVPSSEWNSVAHYTENAQRQIIGQFGNGDYAIITCEGRSFDNSDGWTVAEAQTICQKHGLKFAYNLDGGGSTETMLGLKHINTIYEGTTGRKVPTFIVFNGTDSFGKSNEPNTPDVPEKPKYNIPSDYTEVTYIKTTGKQYINTNIPETELFTVEYKAVNEYFHGQRGHIMSSTNTYIPFTKRWNDTDTTQVIVHKFKGAETLTSKNTIALTDLAAPYIVQNIYNGDTCSVYVNGKLTDTVPIGDTASANNFYYLFAYGGNLSADHYYFTGKLYYLILKDLQGNLIHNFVPVKNNSGTFGLFDTVNQVFYASETTTPFEGAE